MKCVDCPYFRIAYEPIKADRGYWDLGRAECKKHNLVTDFANHGKLHKLECVDGKPPQEKTNERVEACYKTRAYRLP